ncbi:MAG: thiamine-monophosphate kinase [Candidatus Riflebacteria bacterium]|nr:thiamine-monophosphate kinase [Candidatus Riflebacteria bacterium]
MGTLDHLTEFSLINRLTGGLARHPRQVNRTHQADAEIVRLADGTLLAATVDGIHEEYSLGLIRDPFILGWCVVSHSLSDLAAVGATPLGVLLALNFPRTAEESWQRAFFAGVEASVRAHGTHVLGGDTNFAPEPAFTCTALGTIDRPEPTMRTGAKPGDALYITGHLGTGNLLGITSQADKALWAKFEQEYKPLARLKEGKALAPFVSCAIDTSDALLQGLAIIAGLNGVGIEFEHRTDLYFPPLVQITEKIRFPLWLVNVFGMGEYELILGVPKEREPDFQARSKAEGFTVFPIGRVTSEPGITLVMDGQRFPLDVPWLLNLFATCSDIQAYLKELVAYDARLRGSR